MSMLFEVHDRDDGGPKKKRTKKAPKDEGLAEPAPPARPHRDEPAEDRGNLGVIEDVYQCKRCQASYFDIAEEYEGWWFLYCAFCGAYQWEVVYRKAGEQPASGGYPGNFVLRDGIYAGKSLDEVAAMQSGPAYIKFTARKSRIFAVQQACEKFARQHEFYE